MTGPQIKFAEGVAMGLSQTDAYRAAFPKCKPTSVEANAFRLMANDGVVMEIERLRAEAARLPGSAVLTIAEKRDFIARVVRCKVGEEPHDSDLWSSVKVGPQGAEYRLPDKLAAIKADNDLAGDGSEAEGSDALAEFLRTL